MKVADYVSVIEKFYPPKLAQSWDNTGLLIGDGNSRIKNILITIDITASVLAEAKAKGCNFIISYHPVIWDGLKTIHKGSVAYELIKNNISVYSIHTALDVVTGGVNDGLAEMVGITDAKPIGDFVSCGRNNYKLVVFVPAGDLQKVADAVFNAGAGAIGNYSRCGFSSKGQGSFFPLAGSRPAVGTKGKLTTVEEMRFEAIVPADKVEACIAAMRKAHRYEMPAFDVIKLYDMEDEAGLGRIGKLAKPTRFSAILERIKSITGAKAAGIVGSQKRLVKTAAVCAGSCGKLIEKVISSGCDLYLTGEIKHHQALAASEAGLTVICLSHSVSERFILKKVAKQLQNSAKDVKILLSRKDTDPFEWKMI